MTSSGPQARGDGEEVPGWLAGLAQSAVRMPVPAPLRVPAGGGRQSAVLILFGDGPGGPDLLLIQRSPWLRRHAGQPAFPGGAVDKADAGPVSAALREAAEEARVNPASVQVLAVLPELFIWRSGFSVTPVLAWWRRPGPVGPGDPMEVAAVARVRIAELADPANRMTIRYPSGVGGPAFRVSGMLVWGFTAVLVDRLLALGGWELPWDSGRVEDLPPEAMPAGEPAPGDLPVAAVAPGDLAPGELPAVVPADGVPTGGKPPGPAAAPDR
jgi:8-oxo-dGTP pyrophosphatase MutT (NUDIX family)